MNYQDFIKKGLLKEDKIGFDQINKVIEKSYKNLRAAKILLDHDDEETAFKLAYEAMLLAGRALVFSYGLRPRTVNSHRIVVEFTGKVLGSDYDILISKFDKMRRIRHYLIYGAGLSISSTETKNAINSACELIDKISEIIQSQNPQKKLFKK